ncbi:hypothetical protein MCUN1_000283 [Malassezia cuniculi]|uniref:Eukaryotic translation initiation factor 3 subunit D n=1 Tax=Malassezia cuniculi TaxID=948313 RepID=A0AAF0ER14_9BASI|nr:hypothetical protein MCUN1_000283 [Malassezia cuniculi]
MASFSLPNIASDSGFWGPSDASASTVLSDDLQKIPYAPFLKTDRIGRIADWNAGSQPDERAAGAAAARPRAIRAPSIPAPATGVNMFTYFHGDDESSFSLVENSRASAARRPLTSATRGRGAAAARPAAVSRGDAASSAGRGRARAVPQAAQRGARRGGWRDWERTQRKAREASITVGPEWQKVAEMDFVRLGKLRLDVEEPETISTYGTLYAYDRTYDRVSVRFEKPLQPRDRVHYNPTTSEDPVIQQFAAGEQSAQVFATDSIIALLMCSTRSVYPWDIVITKTEEGKIFFDKRANGPFDFVTVNENANEPPIELTDPANPNPENSTRAQINTPSALSLEATFVNENFGFQVVDERKSFKFGEPNPFQTPGDEGQLASCGYRYRRFNLSTDEEDPVELIVRAELNAYVPGASANKPPSQYITIRTLNEFDSRAPGAGGAPDWRLRLDTSRGAVVATEMKNNSFKLARFAVQSSLAGADNMKLGYISRANPLDPYRHVILGTSWFKPRELALQMAYNVSNGWGIVRTIIDVVRNAPAGRFVLLKDPNRPVVRLYSVPWDFEQIEEEEEEEEVAAEATEEQE